MDLLECEITVSWPGQPVVRWGAFLELPGKSAEIHAVFEAAVNQGNGRAPLQQCFGKSLEKTAVHQFEGYKRIGSHEGGRVG